MENSTKNYYAGEVSLTQFDSPGQNYNQNGIGSPPTDADFLNFINSDYLQGHIFYKLRTVTVSSNLADGDYVRPPQTGSVTWAGGNANLYGLLDTNSTVEFADGDRTILPGGHFPGDGECLVSSDLAQLNNLNIGDTVPLTIDGDNVRFTISGIYSDQTAARTSQTVFSPENNRRNDIIVDYTFFDGRRANEDTELFQLKNASDISTFQDELYSKGLSTSYTLQYDIQRYEQQVRPIEAVKQIVLTFSVIILIVGCGIMIMLNMLALRERNMKSEYCAQSECPR